MSKIKNIAKHFFRQQLNDYLEVEKHPIQTLRELELKVFSIVLTLINVVCIPLILIGFVEAIMLGQFHTGLLYIVLYLPILLITIFSQRIAHKLKIFIILFTFLIFAIHNMIVYAMSGVSIPVLLVLVMLSVVFLNFKYAILMLCLSFVSMIPIAVMFVTEKLTLSVGMASISKQTISWITAGSVLVFLGFLIISSYGIIKHMMLKFQIQMQNHSKELERLNKKLKNDIEERIRIENELNEYKINLEKKVDDRTFEIKKKNEELEKLNQLFVGREFRIKELKNKLAEMKENMSDK